MAGYDGIHPSQEFMLVLETAQNFKVFFKHFKSPWHGGIAENQLVLRVSYGTGFHQVKFILWCL